MQKYYHKGAFFQVRRACTDGAVGADHVCDRTWTFSRSTTSPRRRRARWTSRACPPCCRCATLASEAAASIRACRVRSMSPTPLLTLSQPPRRPGHDALAEQRSALPRRGRRSGRQQWRSERQRRARLLRLWRATPQARLSRARRQRRRARRRRSHGRQWRTARRCLARVGRCTCAEPLWRRRRARREAPAEPGTRWARKGAALGRPRGAGTRTRAGKGAASGSVMRGNATYAQAIDAVWMNEKGADTVQRSGVCGGDE
jgi:hypothetical protein